MTKFYLSMALLIAFAGSVTARAATCDTVTKISIQGGAAHDSGSGVGALSFTFSSGQVVTPPVEWSYNGSGVVQYADPAVLSGMVALLTAARFNHAKVCYDESTYTLSLE